MIHHDTTQDLKEDATTGEDKESSPAPLPPRPSVGSWVTSSLRLPAPKGARLQEQQQQQQSRVQSFRHSLTALTRADTTSSSRQEVAAPSLMTAQPTTPAPITRAQLRADHRRLTLSLDKRIQLQKQQQQQQQQQQSLQNISHTSDATGDATTSHGGSTPHKTTVSSALAVLLAVLAGLFVIVQTGMNTSLRRTAVPSGLATSGLSFLIGLATIAIISLVHQFPTQVSPPLADIPWYAYTGGLLGAGFVTAAIYLAPQLGFATFQLAIVAGQLVSGMVCDTVGFLHLSPSPATPWRCLCAALVLTGTALSAQWTGWNTTWQAPLYLLLAIFAGSVFPIQACVNYELGQHVGTPYRAVAVNFWVGSLAMWLAVLLEFWTDPSAYDEGMVNADLKQDYGEDDYDYQWWFWMGGCFGALIVTSITIGIPAIGAVPFTVIFISTQLLVAVVADAVGAFGYTVVPLDAFGGRRMMGVVVAVVAATGFKVKPPTKMLQTLDHWPAWCCCGNHAIDEELLDLDQISEVYTSFHVSIKLDEVEASIKPKSPDVTEYEA